MNYTASTVTGKVTSVSAASAFASGASFTGTYNAAGTLTALTVVTASGTSFTFNAASGDFVSANYLLNVSGSNEVPYTSVGAPFDFNYQAFGNWTTGIGTGAGTAGVFSIGLPSAAASVPTTGSAVFGGLVDGQYISTDGTQFLTLATFIANTNFSTRTLTVSSSDTNAADNLAPVFTYVPNANLNFTGTLTYSAGSAQFSGALTTVGGGTGNAPMTGTANGQFYGPAATELGGAFILTGPGGVIYGAGFGAKR